MIAKLIKGNGFRGALEYDLRQSKGYLLETNMAGDDPRTLAREFGQVRALRPNLTKAVCHVSIGLPPWETLTDEQWCKAARAYLKGMGYNDSQYVVSRHTDAEHQHIHILANRISMTGEVVSDSRDYQRQEAVMRHLEKELGLTVLKPSREAQRRAPTKGEIEHALRTGKASTKQRLQKLVDLAVQDTPSFEEFTARLEAASVEVIPNKASTGTISGISFRLEGVMMKGSDLGRGYTWANLQKRGVQYGQGRSGEEHGRGIEREGHRSHQSIDGHRAGREARPGGISSPAASLTVKGNDDLPRRSGKRSGRHL